MKFWGSCWNLTKKEIFFGQSVFTRLKDFFVQILAISADMCYNNICSQKTIELVTSSKELIIADCMGENG